MINPTKVRYWLGKSAWVALDAAVTCKALPARFPAGLHLEHDLQRFLEAPVRVIVDGGANIGVTALRFAHYFPLATVHAYEPVKSTFHRLEARTKSQLRIFCKQFALGEQQMELSIVLSSDPEQNSLLNPHLLPEGPGGEPIRVVRLDQDAERQGLSKIDVLKLDLEGYELPALRGASGLLEKGAIRAIYAECGFVRNDRYKTSFGELHEFLLAHGFIFSGFYQTYRQGPGKRWAGFSNGLWLHP